MFDFEQIFFANIFCSIWNIFSRLGTFLFVSEWFHANNKNNKASLRHLELWSWSKVRFNLKVISSHENGITLPTILQFRLWYELHHKVDNYRVMASTVFEAVHSVDDDYSAKKRPICHFSAFSRFLLQLQFETESEKREKVKNAKKPLYFFANILGLFGSL